MKLGAVVLDCADAEELADFYSRLLGWKKTRYDAEWVFVASENGEGVPLVFQQTKEYVRPVWPTATGKQQQMQHLDFYVDDVRAGVAHAVACGAKPAESQLAEDWHVMLDPAGHPFCVLPSTPPDETNK